MGRHEHDHDWVRDPGSREGLICSICGVTEAEEAVRQMWNAAFGKDPF